ncbi:hypothetical protein [Siphonobacter curvatus]|uniref:hypothetical protein n=1 Tax=Siphonobacter curvatus TaxID=2094562 RepID=UPI0013FE1E14|nr:hypothetical protein [Siphonobacter curvatus]
MDVTDVIRCPDCGHVQHAVIRDSYPFPTYLHDCEMCDYTIQESEWISVKDEEVNTNEQ